MNWYLEPLKKYAVFSGRSRRKEYWYFTLFTILTMIALSIIDQEAGLQFQIGGESQGILFWIFYLAILIPCLALGARRLHDIGRTGWWLLLYFVCIIGPLVILIWACIPSTLGENQYGPNPIGE